MQERAVAFDRFVLAWSKYSCSICSTSADALFEKACNSGLDLEADHIGYALCYNTGNEPAVYYSQCSFSIQ